MPRGAVLPPGYLQILIWVPVLLGLYITSLYSYLLFHSLAEIFSVVIAVGVFAIAWNSRRFLENNYLLFLGAAFLFVGLVDLLHTLAYKGMGVFPGFGANLPTQLWIAARYLEAFSLLLAPLFLHRKLRIGWVFTGYSLVFLLLVLAIFHWGLFPDCYREGAGLTVFKIVSEYVICFILLGAMALLLKERRQFDRDVLRLLVWSIFLTIGAELAFTFYVGVYDLSNLVGHIFKILAYYLIYKALIETGLVKPYNLLFRDLKQSEERLSQVNAELEQKVKEVSLHRAELEAANKELETFSYSVSHDLRAPLRGITGFSRILAEEYAGRLEPEARNLLQRVQEAAQQMAQLIDALLSLSRMMRVELKRQPVNLSALAATIAADLQRSEPQRRVEFAITPNLLVQGDPAMLRAVLENLLGNAWKFTGKLDQARIEFGNEPEDSAPVFFIRDNGAGFDSQYAQKLFHPFQRLHGADEFPGTGIGLATVQRIIKRHGGRIWAEGDPGRGATFYFTLPAD
jgi:signal transduction histidine kinase